MRRRVKADDVAFDILFKMDVHGFDTKDWRRVENLVRWLFVTKCTDNEVEVAMVTEKDLDMLRFFVEWEVSGRGKDVKVNIGGREIQFRKCRVCNIGVSDFKTYDGDALSITIGLTHSGIAVRD